MKQYTHYHAHAMGQKKKTHTIDPHLLHLCAAHHDRLVALCSANAPAPLPHRFWDVFQDTVLVACEQNAATPTDVEGFTQHFLYKFRMLDYRERMVNRENIKLKCLLSTRNK